MAKSIDYSQAILITILLLLLPLFFIIKKLIPQTPPLPPSPHPWPPLFSAVNHFLRPLTHTSLAVLARSDGPLFRLNLGTRPHIFASSPAAAEAILRANDRALSARAVPAAVPLSPPQVERLSFWADPAAGNWKSNRAVCRAELFSAAALEAQARRREEKAAEMVERLRRKEGAAADVGAAAYAAVVNMFGGAFFSNDVFDLDDESEIERVRGLLRGIIGAISAPNLSDLFPFLGVFDLQGLRKKHKELSMKVWEIWKPILEERRRRSEFRHGDFLDSLICRGFEDDQINHLLEELFTAGIDTTTATITRTMKELIATPHSFTKLKQELDAEFGSSPIENLAYLQACMKETLRLHPPAPLMLSHRAGNACQVMGHAIPKDARVSVNVWAIGRDPTAWEEPLEYRPERFLGSTVDFKGNDFEFLPFGAGRRICPGIPMAAKIVPLIVANLVYYFDWESTKGSVDEEFRATSQMREPLMLIPRTRK